MSPDSPIAGREAHVHVGHGRRAQVVLADIVDDADDFGVRRIGTILLPAEEASDDKLLECAKVCPATAILLYDEDGEEVDLFA